MCNLRPEELMAAVGNWRDSDAEVKVLVGLDLGSVCSGFAYGHTAEVRKIHTFHSWPGRGQKPYCKTQSSVYYSREESEESYQALEWGWPAQDRYFRELQAFGESEGVLFVTGFKLHEDLCGKVGPHNESCVLPVGLPVQRVVSDFLARMGDLITKHLQSCYGKQLSRREIQWCFSVPAGWDERAKQALRVSAQMAGLVRGPLCPQGMADEASPHLLKMVLEPEAAAVHCLLSSSQGMQVEPGAQVLVADIGGGALVLTVYSYTKWLKLREVRQQAVSELPNLDLNMFRFLEESIPCFHQFSQDNPSVLNEIRKRWEDIKFSFDGSYSWRSQELEIPRKLANAWRRAGGNRQDGISSYDELTITPRAVRKIFDPLVDTLLQLIGVELEASKVAMLMLVGGTAGSPYVQKRVEETFKDRVRSILIPADPGSAVCQGAVALGISPEIVASRVARRTYAAGIARFFQESDPPESLEVVGEYRYCTTALSVFVRKGERVEAGKCVSHSFRPVFLDQKEIVVQLYSSEEQNPRYTTDAGVRLEGCFSVDISGDLVNQLRRHVLVTMHFGGPWIQAKVRRKDFGNTEDVIEMDHTIHFDGN